MALDPAEAAANALEAIQENGRAVTLTKVTAGVYDPATGTVTPTTKTYEGFGVDFDYAWSERNQAGGLILEGDRKLLLATEGITAAPAPSDTITLHNASGDIVYTAMSVKTLAPNGVPILYTLQIRK